MFKSKWKKKYENAINIIKEEIKNYGELEKLAANSGDHETFDMYGDKKLALKYVLKKIQIQDLL